MMQRDYAQGRVSAGVIREQFLNSLFAALVGGDELSLDFVYGRSGRRDGRGYLEPIDGQQRLTTLFLLHWYIALKEGRGPEWGTVLEGEGRGKTAFRYRVRDSSARFFEELIFVLRAAREESLWEGPDGSPGKWIRDQVWFMRAWLDDPTVAGALTMLDAIHRHRGLCGEVSLYAGLEKITMEVISLGEDIPADDVYLKMNARGKELTGFEKFKAWVVSRGEELELDCKEKDWKLLLDQDWLDHFWWFQKEDSEHRSDEASSAYLRTFMALAVNFSPPGNLPERWETLEREYREDVWLKLFTARCLKRVFAALDLLVAEGQPYAIGEMRKLLHQEGIVDFNRETLWADLVEAPFRASLTFPQRARLHCLMLALEKGLKTDKSSAAEWFRVTRNLIENVELTSNNFRGVLLCLRRLVKMDAGGFSLGALARLGISDKSPSPLVRQLEEEKWKARMMMDERCGDDWRECLREAEQDPVIRGQVEILFSCPDLPVETGGAESEEKSAAALELLRARLRKLKRLMVVDSYRHPATGRDGWLVLRAVLAMCDELELGPRERVSLPGPLNEWSEILGRNRGELWFRLGFQRLLDELKEEGNLVEELEGIVAAESMKAGESWRSDLVRYGSDLLGYSRDRKVQNYRGYGLFLYVGSNSNDADILLGRKAALRNRWIGELSEEGWRFRDDRLGKGWQSGAGEISGFYKGYEGWMDRKSEDSGEIRSCHIGYDSVGWHPAGPDSPMETADFQDEARVTALLAEIRRSPVR